MIEERAEKQKGIVVALVTPLDENEKIDVGSLESLLEWVLSGGTVGVFVGGTAGEGLALLDREREKLFRETVRIVSGRVPVYANISDTGTARCLNWVGLCEKAGVDVSVCTGRISFPQRSQTETRDHLREISAHTDCPIWFYENPSSVPVKHDFERIAEIMDLPGIEGLKYSSSDRDLFAKCTEAFTPARCVMTGNVPDIAFAAECGATGAVAGIGSLVPRACSNAFNAALAGDSGPALMLTEKIESLYRIYGGMGWPYWPSAQKYALQKRGVTRSCRVTAPFRQLGREEKSLVDSVLGEFDEEFFVAGR